MIVRLSLNSITRPVPHKLSHLVLTSCHLLYNKDRDPETWNVIIHDEFKELIKSLFSYCVSLNHVTTLLDPMGDPQDPLSIRRWSVWPFTSWNFTARGSGPCFLRCEQCCHLSTGKPKGALLTWNIFSILKWEIVYNIETFTIRHLYSWDLAAAVDVVFSCLCSVYFLPFLYTDSTAGALRCRYYFVSWLVVKVWLMRLLVRY